MPGLARLKTIKEPIISVLWRVRPSAVGQWRSTPAWPPVEHGKGMKLFSQGFGLRTDLKEPSITARHFQQVSISTAATHDTHHAKHYPWATADR